MVYVSDRKICDFLRQTTKRSMNKYRFNLIKHGHIISIIRSLNTRKFKEIDFLSILNRQYSTVLYVIL